MGQRGEKRASTTTLIPEEASVKSFVRGVLIWERSACPVNYPPTTPSVFSCGFVCFSGSLYAAHSAACAFLLTLLMIAETATSTFTWVDPARGNEKTCVETSRPCTTSNRRRPTKKSTRLRCNSCANSAASPSPPRQMNSPSIAQWIKWRTQHTNSLNRWLPTRLLGIVTLKPPGREPGRRSGFVLLM